jgi:hypothetical protein
LSGNSTFVTLKGGSKRNVCAAAIRPRLKIAKTTIKFRKTIAFRPIGPPEIAEIRTK